MSAEICFDRYLAAIVDKYKQWWRLYTLTDVTGRSREHGSEEPREIPLFDFGLTVQTVQTQKEREQNKEKIEQLPVLEGIRKYASEHVLLVGRPGSGKSTALARLLLDEAQAALADRQAPIPVLVELGYLPSEANQSSVTERILEFIHTHDPALDLDEAVIKLLLRQGRLLLLFDGLNELPSEKSRNQVSLFWHDYQKSTPAIFTTRDLSVGSNLGIEKRLEMQPLTEPQMQEFVRSYLPTQGDLMLQQLGGRLREFGQTPLLLLMLCELFKAGENIPRNLGEVFRVFTGAYEFQSIRNHEIASLKGDVQPLVDRRLWFPALKHLASVMMQGATPVDFRIAISRVEVEKEFKALFRDEPYPSKLARDCLDDLINYHLLQIYSEDYVEFRHQLIQEYYAAEYLFELLPNLIDARLKYDYLNYLKWTEPLALMLDLVESEEQAVLVVRLALDVDLKLGARLAGALKYGFQEKTVELLILEIDDRKIPQLYAIELLGETQSKYATPLLIKYLENGDFDKLWNSIKALTKIYNDKSTDFLRKFFKDKKLYPDSLLKLASYEYPKSSMQFSRHNNFPIRPKNDVSVYAKATITISKPIDSHIESLSVEDFNLRPIDSHIESLSVEDFNLRLDEIAVLGEIGDCQSIKILIQSLKDKDPYIRREVADVLGRIRSDSIDEAVEPLIECFKDKDDEVCCSAAEALGEIGSDKAIEFLLQLLNNENEYYSVRCYAAESLGRIGNNKAVKSLIHVLFDMKSNEDIKISVVEALGRISGSEAIISLIQFLSTFHIRNYDDEDDLNLDTREYTVEVLRYLTDATSNLPTLTQQLPHLVTLIPTEASEQALSVITAIQSRCKYYNYAIAQMTLPPEDKANPNTGNTYNTFNAPVGQVIENQTVGRDNVATQNNPKSLPET